MPLPKTPEHKIKLIKSLSLKDYPLEAIAKAIGVSINTVKKYSLRKLTGIEIKKQIMQSKMKRRG